MTLNQPENKRDIMNFYLRAYDGKRYNLEKQLNYSTFPSYLSKENNTFEKTSSDLFQSSKEILHY